MTYLYEQYGFRPNISNETASYKLINEILVAMNNKMSVGGIFCDLGNAFKSQNIMWIRIQQMQQYADIYLLQSYST